MPSCIPIHWKIWVSMRGVQFCNAIKHLLVYFQDKGNIMMYLNVANLLDPWGLAVFVEGLYLQ